MNCYWIFNWFFPQSYTSEFIYAEPLEVFPDSDGENCDVDDDPGKHDSVLSSARCTLNCGAGQKPFIESLF